MLSSAGRLTPPVSVGSYRYKGDAQRLTHPTPAVSAGVEVVHGLF